MLLMGAFGHYELKILTMLTDIWRKTIKFVFGKFCANCAY